MKAFVFVNNSFFYVEPTMNSVDELIQEFVKGDDGKLSVGVGTGCLL